MGRVGKKVKRIKNPKIHVPEMIPVEMPGIQIEFPAKNVPVPVEVPALPKEKPANG